MSKKNRQIKKCFKVFCEGDTEYNYIDEMRRQMKLSIALKPINMKGGGYSSFLDELRTDGNANCLAKFIIIDGDKAVSDAGEMKKLKELIEYCITQNKSKRVPHFLIVDYPDFEYLACLHIKDYKGQDVSRFITKEMGYKSVDDFKADTKVYIVLNSNDNSKENMLIRLSKSKKFIINKYTVNRSQYEINAETTVLWDNLGYKGSNISEFFDIVTNM